MQAAFTKKTQEVAEARKQAEAIQAKAAELDKYSPYIPVLNEMMASQNKVQDNPEMVQLANKLKEAGYSDEAIDMMKMGAETILNQFKQTQASEKQEAYITSRLQEAAKLDPRLNDKSLTYDIDGEQHTFGRIVEELVAADPKWTQDPYLATQRAIKKVDALIGKAKTEGKQELSATARAKATKFPSSSSSPQKAVDASTPLSIRDAFKQAAQETGINI